MKILILNASDVKGGAAKVGYLLAKGLVERHHEVCYLVQHQSATDTFIQEIPRPIVKHESRTIPQRIIHRLGINQLGLTETLPFRLEADFVRQFDLVHLHDLPTFNLAGLPWLSRLIPTVWTMHTMAAFTGNCLYSYDCDRWQSSCGNCPQFGKFPVLWLHRDGSGLNINLKRLIYQLSQLHIIGVSNWISDQAKKGILGRFPVQTILNPVDTKDFYPIVDRTALRQSLNIPIDAEVILFSVSGKVEDQRKGLDIILKALPQLTLNNLYLIPLGIAGAGTQIAEALAGFAHREFAHVSDVALLNKLLSAADLVWHPSRADTSSLMSLEAFAAGTPVIAASVGGVPEVIGDAGILMPPDDPSALVEATHEFLGRSLQERQATEEYAVDYVKEKFNLNKFITAHEHLYKSLI
ncbi:glycosyl transferase group 1 [[Leptolyngbya] sp. PCC 7376]|uniref:glycosyltransferase n=1 Tax=[Leptolyngbya] sp. PCC 7376 TaxID=111781 RepID=UPI00029F4A94|nr:glycosyltransferase [[Leptolyngbya] sp. PCC 7376]AFY37246.1 glycosyl transferase group 1 [[Leptolyngbya] sp. PCC 7376]